MDQIFVNLPVADLPVAKAFWEKLGFSFNPQFTNDDAACLVLGEHAFVMLLTKPFFSGFTDKAILDTKTHIQVINALSVKDREAVDAMVSAAIAAGGRSPRPAKDYGFMYQHSFEDPDGHLWEVFFMGAMPPQTPA
nr:VOC family protein [Aquabacter cavernae]